MDIQWFITQWVVVMSLNSTDFNFHKMCVCCSLLNKQILSFPFGNVLPQKWLPGTARIRQMVMCWQVRQHCLKWLETLVTSSGCFIRKPITEEGQSSMHNTSGDGDTLQGLITMDWKVIVRSSTSTAENGNSCIGQKKRMFYLQYTQYILLLTSSGSENIIMEGFYLTTHSTHFIYGFLASDIWYRTIQIAREETHFCHIGYSFQIAARVLLYALSHRQCMKMEIHFTYHRSLVFFSNLVTTVVL